MKVKGKIRMETVTWSRVIEDKSNIRGIKGDTERGEREGIENGINVAMREGSLEIRNQTRALLVISILQMILWNGLTGAMALAYTLNADKKYKEGKFIEALEEYKKVKVVTFVGIIVSMILIIICIGIYKM